MLRRITRNRQLSIPAEFMTRLHLNEGDYVTIECDGSTLKVRPVVIEELTDNDYKKLAAKLTELKKEAGKRYDNSQSARKHLKRLMK